MTPGSNIHMNSFSHTFQDLLRADHSLQVSKSGSYITLAPPGLIDRIICALPIRRRIIQGFGPPCESAGARVGHVRVDPRAAVPVRPGARPASDGLIIAHILVSKGQVVHATLQVGRGSHTHPPMR